ncbi:dihydroorotate dehydrogenase (quinone), mitochondrial-like isoform X2 [Saccostrea cucullata]|uniref:dihydroorotate dehydrogenase (quinone), mitochondrial-like isoform X2 n=1 Tax=Saccostrea cuccullata TaxID=36930 RepID=UPI002ED50F90
MYLARMKQMEQRTINNRPRAVTTPMMITEIYLTEMNYELNERSMILFQKRLKDMAVIVSGAAITFAGYSIYEGNEKFYREILMPLTHKCFDAETAHRLGVLAAKYNIVPRKQKKPDSPILSSVVFGREFSNPVGLAAGFDKDGEGVRGLKKLGFGFIEIGSVTPKPQPGNPKPRVFRLTEDGAVINRYGFNSEGHQAVYNRLKDRLSEDKDECLLGVNLGKNKTSSDPEGDYTQGVQKFSQLADYLVVNISSPNTPGLRDLQGKQRLQNLLDKVIEKRDEMEVRKPLLVKIAPDLTDQDKADIAAVVTSKKGYVSGLIVSNTTVKRPVQLKSPHKNEEGGLSGHPLADLSTNTISDMYRLTKGTVPIIGVGGVHSGEEAYRKIRSGASLIQLYTALVYEGPPVVKKIKRELEELLKRDGFSNISEAVGVDVKL